MSDLAWHIKLAILHDDDAASLEVHHLSISKGEKEDLPLIKYPEPTVQVQDGAGLRKLTETEHEENRADGEAVLHYVEKAAWYESRKIDEHKSEKMFFVISRPAENGVYSMELHLDSLSGPLIRKSKALSRARAAELLVALEESKGAVSVYEE